MARRRRGSGARRRGSGGTPWGRCTAQTDAAPPAGPPAAPPHPALPALPALPPPDWRASTVKPASPQLQPLAVEPGAGSSCSCTSGQGWPGGGATTQAGCTISRGSVAGTAAGASSAPAPMPASRPCHCSSAALPAALPSAAGRRSACSSCVAGTRAAVAEPSGESRRSTVRWVQPGLQRRRAEGRGSVLEGEGGCTHSVAAQPAACPAVAITACKPCTGGCCLQTSLVVGCPQSPRRRPPPHPTPKHPPSLPPSLPARTAHTPPPDAVPPPACLAAPRGWRAPAGRGCIGRPAVGGSRGGRKGGGGAGRGWAHGATGRAGTGRQPKHEAWSEARGGQGGRKGRLHGAGDTQGGGGCGAPRPPGGGGGPRGGGGRAGGAGGGGPGGGGPGGGGAGGQAGSRQGG